MERLYYIYRHLRGDNGQPFYIGQGVKPTKMYPSTEYARAYSKKERSDFWNNVVNKYGYTVEIMLDDISEQDIDAKEMEFIALYGRIKDGGILCNLTDGGEGNKGYISSESTKKLLSDINTISIEDHIRDSVFPEPNTGCWLWAGTVDKRYDRAVIHRNGHSGLAAHKVFFEHFTGTKVPKGKFLARTCKNAMCVNPDHCYIGKFEDRDHKGRPRKYKHHRQILTEEIVLKARELKRTTSLNMKQISEQLQCGYRAISFALNGKSWGWLNG